MNIVSIASAPRSKVTPINVSSRLQRKLGNSQFIVVMEGGNGDVDFCFKLLKVNHISRCMSIM